MELEQRLWREIEKNLTTTLTTTVDGGATFSLQTLSSIHSLITNPTTTAATIDTVLITLTTALSHSLDPQSHFHILSLLSTLSLHHRNLSAAAATAAATILISSPSARISAAALSLLISIPAVDFDSVDDSVLVSICFRPCVAVRVWFLNNASRFKIQPNLLVTVMLGFTKDPYPNVRRAAVIGLARVCEAGVVVEDCDVVEACYFRAVELLRDDEDYVRQAAVRAVGEWGRKLAALKPEEIQRDWFDAVFLKLCSTVRDMSVGVRVEGLTALGKFTFLSEDILLQSLSKKVLAAFKAKQSVALCSAAGAFIHGLEDEFSEVQQAACITLRMLPVVSGQFAGEAVNIVSYVLNDDSINVRLEALNTLQHIAMSGCLKMQEVHIDMLLGTLMDSYLPIRFKAIHIVGSLKLSALKLSQVTVESLLGSLDMYPKSEANIFRALFGMGQNNEHHSVSIIEDFCHEIEPSDDGKFGCNNHRVAGLIVLAVSASLKNESCRRRIPQKIFSYAAAFFGRISHAFTDTLDADSLLQYLSQYGNWCSEAQPEPEAQPVVRSAAEDRLQTSVLILEAVKLILATVNSLWGLVKSGHTNEVLRSLRYCKESLTTLKSDSSECAGAVAFALQYLSIVKLISKIWKHSLSFGKCNLHQIGNLDILLAKLDKHLLSLRFTFSGLEEEDNLYISELLLLSYVLTLSSFHEHSIIWRKLRTTIDYIHDMRTTKSVISSNFLDQLSDFSSRDDKTCDPSALKKLHDIFVLRDYSLTEKIRQISAELSVIGFDAVTPLRFIPGLPVGVPLEITLYNVASDNVVWVKLTMVDELTEFVFLDLEELDDLQETGQLKITLPFYRTPSSETFTLRISVGLECMVEYWHPVKDHGSVEHPLTYISPELEVYFVLF